MLYWSIKLKISEVNRLLTRSFSVSKVGERKKDYIQIFTNPKIVLLRINLKFWKVVLVLTNCDLFDGTVLPVLLILVRVRFQQIHFSVVFISSFD